MTFFQDFPVPPAPPRGRAVRYVPPVWAGAPLYELRVAVQIGQFLHRSPTTVMALGLRRNIRVDLRSLRAAVTGPRVVGRATVGAHRDRCSGDRVVYSPGPRRGGPLTTALSQLAHVNGQ